MDIVWITCGIAVGVFGAMVGSFLNVCIWRIPLEQSIVFPASHCPACSHAIRFYDNIPIISYLILKGKCRDCQERISPRYPFVEALTGLFAFLLFWKYGLSLQLLCSFLFTASLIVITFIDIDYQIIPDVISLPGIPLCFLAAVFVMEVPFWESLLGIVGGGGVLYLFAACYEWIKKEEGMGGGDIKLLAMLGAFWGWKSLLFILLISSCVGALVGIFMILRFGRDMKYALPFGPFLALGAVLYFFLGEVFQQILWPV
ncbi:MAG: prepilin peptidase [Syntrophobacterales bacterium]|jgi:leader peptidase (prepilin peptidase)/N-methyltransferase|nr:prepilin peptidase [Syntrophobacterales bacterium]